MLTAFWTSDEEGTVTITIICRDLESDATAVFKAPYDNIGMAQYWLVGHLTTKFMAKGLNTEAAKERAADFEIRCAFAGDCLELKI